MLFGGLEIILLKGLFGAAAAAAVITVAYLALSIVIDWFRDNGGAIEDNVPFTIEPEDIENATVLKMGIFSNSTGEVIASAQMSADEIDEEIIEAHKNSKIVTYE